MMESTQETVEVPQETIEIPEPLQGIHKKIDEKFADKILDTAVFRDELTFTIAIEDWVEVLTFCKESPDLNFDRLDCLVGNHYPGREQPFELAAHLVSISKKHRLRVKAPLAEDQKAPTLSGVWASANWDERETYEMFGIEFEGHPNLIRLLTTPDFEGFPLRKDFPLAGTVGGRIRTNLKGKI